MNDNETIADIIEEMRRHGQYNIDEEKGKPVYGILTVEGKIIKDFADQLDAAHKREVDALKQRCVELVAEVAAKDEVIKRLNDAISEEQRRKMATAENSSAVGDCAKLREALVSIKAGILKRRSENVWYITDSDILEKIDAALTAPPRNCDVGTAEEQYARYEDFCCKHYKWNCSSGTCLQCPFSEPTCKFSWAQLPYESEAGK